MRQALALGRAFFVVRLALCGGDWASYSANQHIYQNGVLKSSTLTDRNGVILAQTENGAWRYADDPAVRLSSVHAVGDYRGYISGAISAFADELAGYSFVYGTPAAAQKSRSRSTHGCRPPRGTRSRDAAARCS